MRLIPIPNSPEFVADTSFTSLYLWVFFLDEAALAGCADSGWQSTGHTAQALLRCVGAASHQAPGSCCRIVSSTFATAWVSQSEMEVKLVGREAWGQ